MTTTGGRSNGRRAGEVVPPVGSPRYSLQVLWSIPNDLSPSEARVANVILERPFEVLEWSAAELGAAAGTSAATAVRACKSLGFEGLDQLRLTLARELGWQVPEPPPAASGAGDLMQDLFIAASQALPTMLRTVDPAALERVVDALVDARQVLVVASGADSSSWAVEVAYALTTIGRPAITTSDQRLQHVTARSLGPGDLCLAVSQSGASRATIEASTAAHDAGALVVAFGTQARSRIEDVADISVGLQRLGPSVEMASAINRVGVSLALRGLVHAVRLRLGDRAEEALRVNLDLMSVYHHRVRRS